MKKNILRNIITLLTIFFFIIFFSCTKDYPVVKQGKKTDYPTRSIVNTEVIFRDSGIVKTILRSPLIEEFSLVDSPYWLFKKGININFYERGEDKPGYFQANWAKLGNSTGIYEGRGNAFVVNSAGDSLKSDQLFWDDNKKIFYTNKKVFLISNKGDSITSKHGLKATEDLQSYTLYNNSGFIKVEDNLKL